MKNNKGFSLVELIVVIAIMAILAAVAVVGVSVYIPKAQQAADKQMIADIEYVLSLHAQSNPNDVTAGYIVLTPDGEAKASDGFVTEVLKATYGDDWAKELMLDYDGWEEDSLLMAALSSDVELLANSTYFQNASTQELLDVVNTLTGAATNALNATGKGMESVDNMFELSDEDRALFDKELEGLTEGTDEYNTTMSNLFVTVLAGQLSDYKNDRNDDDVSLGAGLALAYSSMYAFSLTNPDAAREMEAMNERLGNAKSSDELSQILNEGFSANVQAEYVKYSESAQCDDDLEAFLGLMNTVDSVSGELTDYQDKDMYKSEQISGMLGSYTEAVNAFSGLSNDDLLAIRNAYQAGDIVIVISNIGSVMVFPANTQ